MTQSDSNSDRQSPDRCRPAKRRRRLFLAVIALLTVAACASLLAWHLASPRLTFLLLKSSFISGTPRVTDSAVEESKLLESITEQLTPLLVEAVVKNSQYGSTPEATMAQQLVIKTLNASLPVIIQSFRSSKQASLAKPSPNAMSDATKFLIPLTLRISPKIWSEWMDAIAAGHFSVNECRTLGTRAACELLIRGPREQSATVALLWEKSSWFWRLQGVIGLDRVIEAMRATPEVDSL